MNESRLPRQLTDSEFRELALLRFLAWKSVPLLGLLLLPTAACSAYSLFVLWRIAMEERVVPEVLASPENGLCTGDLGSKFTLASLC